MASSFSRATLVDVKVWVQGIPKPPKAIDKRYFVVLKCDSYEDEIKVIVCKACDDELGSSPQAIKCKMEELGMWITSYCRHYWQHDYENCEEQYRE